MEDGISPDCSLKWSRGGYDAEWQVLNSKDFGVPQNRERCFIIGHLRSRGSTEVFPVERADGENSVSLNLFGLIDGKNSQKVSMWLLVVVGAIIDEMLLYASTTIGWKSPVAFLIACVVAMWLICNEIISILENIQDMGVKIPAFLQPLVKHIRSQVEEQINTEKIEEKDSDGE